jgi:adenosylcobyric acid synthase
MLGREICDPIGVESGGKRPGFGFLNVATELTREKTTLQVEAQQSDGKAGRDEIVRGYEIHMGRTNREHAAPRFRILCRLQSGTAGSDIDDDEYSDGAISDDGRVWGTYIHGVFDRPGFRRLWLNQIRERKGLTPAPATSSEKVTRRLSSAIERWADHVQRHLNLIPIFDAVKPISSQQECI